MTTLRPFTLLSPRLPVRGRRAFSLVEMLVAIAIFSVLLAAVFIPIKIAADLSSVGTSRANTQQAAVDGLRLIKSDISKAIVILPNDRTNGITDVHPYTSNKANPTDPPARPAFPYRRDPSGYQMPTTAQGTGQSTLNACNSVPAPNTARLDLILPATNDKDNIDPNIRHNSVLVSYYARRRDMTKAFDPIQNPVVLYRAQIPFQTFTGASAPVPFLAKDTPTAYNANLSNNRFGPFETGGTCNADTARGLQWLTMNQYGEFDLTRLCLYPNTAATSPTPFPNAPSVFGSHQLVLPRDTALLTPNAAPFAAGTPPTMGTSLVPDTTFICSDTNKDGKIDTVTIQLSVGQYDENAANRRSTPGTPGKSMLVPQVARTLTETVFNPNVQ